MRLYTHCIPFRINNYSLSPYLYLKLLLFILSLSFIYAIEEKAEHFDNCFFKDFIKK